MFYFNNPITDAVSPTKNIPVSVFKYLLHPGPYAGGTQAGGKHWLSKVWTNLPDDSNSDPL